MLFLVLHENGIAGYGHGWHTNLHGHAVILICHVQIYIKPIRRNLYITDMMWLV